MNKMILQFIIRQWDKSQRSEQAIKGRNALPDRYPVQIPPAKSLFEEYVIIDQHGDDLLGSRLQYQLVDNYLLIDRFRFDLYARTVEFKARLTNANMPKQLTKIDNGWRQFQYEWRYRVDDGGYIYWLYENITLNACFSDNFDQDIFVKSEPQETFFDLITKS
ncbi:MAG: hypothetical protein R3341_09180 [Methylophaga sp.]|nr:hypothetical protein [Methylophaga sp.]